MATELTVAATEQSTYVVTATFTDENNDSVIPNSLSWTLTDVDGNVINSRQDVVVTPASTISIVLSGDDLAMQTGEIYTYAWRIVTIEGVYTSSLGSNLPLKGEAKFKIQQLTNV